MNNPGIYFHRRIVGILSQPQTTAALWLLFSLIDFPYQYGFRYLSLAESLAYTLIDATLYTAILWLTTRLDLARATLCFLALPYLIFIPGWLNIPTAIILLTIFIICMMRTLQQTSTLKNNEINLRDFIAFLLILVWVNLSGIGGYGFQWADYAVNNARLHDLIVQEWPIRYGENRNFVYYFGYFLPAAIVGKIFSVNIALRSVYVWAALGVTLAVRWLSYLSKWRFSFSLVVIFILFGPIDILNLFYIQNQLSSTPVTEFFSTFRNDDLDTLNFTATYTKQIKFFLGNYPGNSFQLYWSPQQLIAGWLCAALMMHLFLEQKIKQIVFIFSLLCLWGPLVMIALLPFILVTGVTQLFASSLLGKRWRDLLSFENTIGAGSLACVFVIFYLSGSSASNPSFWMARIVDWHKQWDLILVFYLAAWGIYALALIPFILKSEISTRIWFACLVFALAILPLRIFGLWSDLLCRGSAPLMFLLLVFFLRAIHYYWHDHQKIRAVILLCLLVPGTATAFLINSVSSRNTYYGQTELVKPLLSYAYKDDFYENFGPDDSLFNHLFRRSLPDDKPGQQNTQVTKP